MCADHAQIVDETLLRGIGVFDMKLDELSRSIRSPVKWASVGMNYILTLPIRIFVEFGILSKKTYDWIAASLVIRAIVFAVWFLGGLSAIMSIIMGWSDFLKMVKPVLNLG